MATETVLRKVTIDYSDSPRGIVEVEAEVLTHTLHTDGSETILLKTPPRESVQKFLHEEMVEQL